MKYIDRIIDFIVKFVAVFGISMGVIVAFANVTARYGFNFSFTWAAELTVYMFLWSMFFTTALLFKTNSHISIGLLVQNIDKRYAKIIFIFTQMVSLIFLAVVGYYGYEYLLLVNELEEMSIDLGIPMWIPYSVIPIAFGIGVYYIASHIVQTIKTPAQEINFKHEEDEMLQEMDEIVKEVNKKTGGLL
ncbi:MAG TPA: TRAP transporter small permease [Arcobacter sp.]|jgi:C4-dicarboxylate transporter DctQ subunit|nr:TRAP transporter small permease [Arcobacter sp.]